MPAKTCRVLLVDDHQMVREGLHGILARSERVEVVGEAGDGLEAIEKVAETSPDVVIMDVGLPRMNGIEATRAITTEHGDVKVIALSAYSDSRYVINMLQAGAMGYVLKDSASAELLRAVDAVLGGHQYLSPEITGVVLTRCVPGVGEGESSAFSLLGAREREVLQRIAEGATTAKIAEQLFIAPKTVETHRRNIMRKLGVRTIAGLTKYAVREGLTSLDD